MSREGKHHWSRNGVCAPVDELDSAILEGVEAAVLTSDSLSYILDRAVEAVRQNLAQDPGRIEALRQRRAETQRKITRLVEAVADGRPPKAFVDQVKALEAELGRMDGEIAAEESRARPGRMARHSPGQPGPGSAGAPEADRRAGGDGADA